MEDISPQAYRLIAENAPDFIVAVHQLIAARTNRQAQTTLFLTLDAFSDDSFTLYSCLWYAASKGIDVTFVADTSGSTH